MNPEHLDVLIVGAGISGISGGYYLQDRCPDKTYAILEGRASIGGTWDLFRYPGIRSDSDMHTMGFAFKPWTNPKTIADAPSILEYLNEAAQEYGIDEHIRFNTKVTALHWNSEHSRWRVQADCGGESVELTAGFIYMCTGYYNYQHGYEPEFPGAERFQGRIVHPQQWTDDIDYADQRVVVIGSGATAVTLIPAMARTAAHVTMLQRSPTYIVSAPAEDSIGNLLRRWLPARLAHSLTRWKNILLGQLFFWLFRSYPQKMAERIFEMAREAMGSGIDAEKHFRPTYKPWDQRMCLAPDGDFFEVLRERRASVVTDHIETFTEHGIALQSGETLPADLIVTATGLELQFLGGLPVEVDGELLDTSEHMAYKGMMYSNVPNLALATGYTNASWTLKCDLTSAFVARLIRHMDRRGYAVCCPRLPDGEVNVAPFLDLTSGYIQRALERLPKQGDKVPWKLYQNYLLDRWLLGMGRVEDGVLQFRQ